MIKKIFVVMLFIFSSMYLVFYGYCLFVPISLEDISKNMRIYDANGNIMYESHFQKNVNWITLEEIPPFIKRALIEVEDQRFYMHAGIDPIRISKALFLNLSSKQIKEGGSTITQQFAKNLFLSNEQTLKRKIMELFYASQMEMQYAKEDILEGYFNTVYYGHGVYGIQNASHYFFNKELHTLDVNEIAMLIGIPNGPSLYSPYIDYDQAMNRKNLILSIFLKRKLIDASTYQKAKNDKLVLVNQNQNYVSTNPYYLDALFQELDRLDIDENNIRIYSTYDPNVQKQLDQSIDEQMQEDDLQCASIIAKPYTGGIMALSGGKNYTVSQFNRALYANRQIASTIKPLLYYCALEANYTPNTTFVSQKTTFHLENHEPYSPNNYGQEYANKEISMIHALAISDNIYAVKTHLALGSHTLVDKLHEFGINHVEDTPSLALGTLNLNLLELSKIYLCFASEGQYVEPYFIESIYQDEKLLYSKEHENKQLLDVEHTQVLSQMLKAPFDSKNIQHSIPTMLGYEPNMPMSVKSGTSDWDSWVMSYNPHYVIGVWCGFDDARHLDKKYYTTSKRIYKETMDRLVKPSNMHWYMPRDNIQEVKVDPIDGSPSNVGSIYWFEGDKS